MAHPPRVKRSQAREDSTSLTLPCGAHAERRVKRRINQITDRSWAFLLAYAPIPPMHWIFKRPVHQKHRSKKEKWRLCCYFAESNDSESTREVKERKEWYTEKRGDQTQPSSWSGKRERWHSVQLCVIKPVSLSLQSRCSQCFFSAAIPKRLLETFRLIVSRLRDPAWLIHFNLTQKEKL